VQTYAEAYNIRIPVQFFVSLSFLANGPTVDILITSDLLPFALFFLNIRNINDTSDFFVYIQTLGKILSKVWGVYVRWWASSTNIVSYTAGSDHPTVVCGHLPTYIPWIFARVLCRLKESPCGTFLLLMVCAYFLKKFLRWASKDVGLSLCITVWFGRLRSSKVIDCSGNR